MQNTFDLTSFCQPDVKSVFMQKLLFLLLLITSCNQVSNTGNYHKIDLRKLDEKLASHKIIEAKRYVFLEYSARSIIKNISKIKIKSDLIYIVDSDDILFVFDINGQFKYSIDSKGQGPSEYLEINDFYFTDSTFILFDSRSKKLLTYNLKGNFLSSKTIGPYFAFNIAAIDEFRIINLKGTSHKANHNILYLKDDEIKNKYFDYDMVYDDDRKSYLFNNEILVSSHTHLYSPGFFSEIYELKKDTVLLKYDLDFGDRELKSKEIFEGISIRNPNSRKENFSQYDYFVSLHKYFETDKALIATFFGFKDQYLLYYNKNSQRSYIKRCGDIDVNELWYGSRSIMAVYKNELVSEISPFALSHMEKAYRENNMNEILRFEKLKVDALKSSALELKNPVLMFWKIKNR